MDRTGRWLEEQQGLSAWDEEEGDGNEVMSDCESLFSLDSLSSAYATALAERLRQEEEQDSDDSQMSEDSLTVNSAGEKSTIKRLHGSPLVCSPHACSMEVNLSQHELKHGTRIVAKPKSPCQKAVGETLSSRIAADNLQANPTSDASSSSVGEPERLQALDLWSSTCAADSARVPRTCLPVQRKEMFPNTVSSSSGGAASPSLSEGRVTVATVKGHILIPEATLQRSQMIASPNNPLTGVVCPEGQSEGLLDSHTLQASKVKSISALTNVGSVIVPGDSRSSVSQVSTSCCPPGEISLALAASSHSAQAEGHCCQHSPRSNILKNNQKSEPAGDGALSPAWDEQPNGSQSEGTGKRCGAGQQDTVRSDCKNSRKRNKEQQDAFTGSLKMLKRSEGAEPVASCTATVSRQAEIWLGSNSKEKLSTEGEQVKSTQHLSVFKGIGPSCPKQDCQSGASSRNPIVIEGLSVMVEPGAEEGSQEASPHMSKLVAICSAIDLRISEVAHEHVRLSFVAGDDEQKQASRSLKASSSAAGQRDGNRATESQFRDESYGPVPELLESDQSIKSRSSPESCTLRSLPVAQEFRYNHNFFDMVSNGGGEDPCRIKTFQSELISHKESRGLISQMLKSNSNMKGFDLREPTAIKDTLFQQASQLVHPVFPPDDTTSETQITQRSTVESNRVLYETTPPGGAREEGCSCKEATSDFKNPSCGFSRQDAPIPILHSLKCLEHNLPPEGENLQPKESRTETAVERNFSVTQSAPRKTGKKANVKKSQKPCHVVQKCVVNVRYSDKCRSCAAKTSKESATSRSEAFTVSDSETNHCLSLKPEQKMTQGAHTQHNLAAASRKVKRLRRSKVPTGLASSRDSSLKSSDEDEEDARSPGVHHSRPQPRCVSPTSQQSRKQEFTPGTKSTSDIFSKVYESRSETKTLEENLDKVGHDSSKQMTVEENQPQQSRDDLMHFACSDINPFVRPWQDANPDQLTHKSAAFGSAADLSHKSPPLITSSIGVRMVRCCSVDDGLNGRDSPPFNSHLSAFAAKRGLSSTLSSVEGGDRGQVASRTPQSGGSGRVDEIMFVYSTEQDGGTLRSRRSCERGTQTAAPLTAAAAKRRERHRRSCTDGVAAAAQRNSSPRETQTWASMESMSAHISKLIDSTSDLLEDVQEMRTGGGARGKRWSTDLSATKRDRTAADAGVQTERPSTPLHPSQHSVNLVVRVVADETTHDVPVAAQRRIRSASSRGSRRGAFTDRASSPILTVGVRRGSKPKGQQTHPLQRRGGNTFTMPLNHQSEGTTVLQDSDGLPDSSSSLDSSLTFGEKQTRRTSPSVLAKAFNTQSISPILRPKHDPQQQVVRRRSLDACRQSFSPVAADQLREDETTSPAPSECNTDILVNMKPAGAESMYHHVVPQDLPLHNKFNNWSGIAARSSASPPRRGGEWNEEGESLSARPGGSGQAGEIEKLRRERERLLATVGVGGHTTPLSVELKEAKLHYGLGETDTLLKMLSVTPSSREEEAKDTTTKQQLYERWEFCTSAVELD